MKRRKRADGGEKASCIVPADSTFRAPQLRLNGNEDLSFWRRNRGREEVS